MTVESFDAELGRKLSACGLDLSSPPVLAVAVSGGADSVSLLTALSHILPASSLRAVTVNHNLREEAETEGDAAFVQDYCTSLSVSCRRYDIARGEIRADARRLGQSLEEAARNARYGCFSRFMEESSSDFLCLAHNRNDQLETLLMRFLAGGGAESLAGMQLRRGCYLRPLLGTARSDIEGYLRLQGVPFRTDSTNADNSLLRNRIRNLLLPPLDEHFSGWSTALLSLSEKMRDDGAFFARELERAKARCRFSAPAVPEGGGSAVAEMDLPCFCREERAVRVRLLFAAADSLPSVGGGRVRIPYAFFSRAADGLLADGWRETCAGLRLSARDGRVVMERVGKAVPGSPSERGFFLVVREEGFYRAGKIRFRVRRFCPAGTSAFAGPPSLVLEASGAGEGAASLRLSSLSFPFAIRSRQPGDELRAAGGGLRSLASVLDGWKCAEKDSVPIVQRLDLPEQPIAAVWGAPLGFKNWVVKY